MQRTCSIDWQVLASANGMRSLMKPGSTPLMKRLELPCCAASSTRAMYFSGITPHGYCNIPGDDPTTLMPVARMRMTSFIASGRRVSPIAQYTTHSGPVASTASRSLTAVMPVDTSTPASAPASLPTFFGDETHTPVSSNCGLVMSSVSARRPTFPVPTWATRIAMGLLRPKNVSARTVLDASPTGSALGDRQVGAERDVANGG